jgi:phosphatidate cytidylyltransferase
MSTEPKSVIHAVEIIMKNLVYRTITSLLAIPVILIVLAGGHYLAFLLGLASLICCLEIATFILPHNFQAKFLASVFCMGLFLSAAFCKDIATSLIFLGPALLFFNIILLINKSIDNQVFEKLSGIFYCSVYVVGGLTSIYWLQNYPEYLDIRVGISFIFLGCLSTWSNDTFAYFGGRLWGRRPLFKRVSAKKTWEGFLSGAVSSIVIVFLIKYLPIMVSEKDWLPGLTNNDIFWVIIPSTLLAPAGDLIESQLKRFYKIKDSSNILPGHGGLLDRIDGLLLVMPWTALYAFIIRPLC